MKKILPLIFCFFTLSVSAMEKETTFKKNLFEQAQSEGKIVIVSSWIKYCSSCASQMKVLKEAKNTSCSDEVHSSPACTKTDYECNLFYI